MTEPVSGPGALGVWLREQRRRLGLTRPQLVAEALRARPHARLSQNYLAKLEYGERGLTQAAPDVREALRTALKVPAAEWTRATGLPAQDAGAPTLTHFVSGQPRMVDVTDKASTLRKARAEAWVLLPPEARAALEDGSNAKGDPLTVARLAGIAGAKRTSDLVLLCHPLPLSGVEVTAELEPRGVRVTATARTNGPTGVEMEALTAVTVAALNVYDMLKAASKAIEITGLRLLSKSGGKSGDYRAPER